MLCYGDLQEMTRIAGVVPELGAKAMRRFGAALAHIGEPKSFDEDRAKALLGDLMALT